MRFGLVNLGSWATHKARSLCDPCRAPQEAVALYSDGSTFLRLLGKVLRPLPQFVRTSIKTLRALLIGRILHAKGASLRPSIAAEATLLIPFFVEGSPLDLIISSNSGVLLPRRLALIHRKPSPPMSHSFVSLGSGS
jgi:hypothetical protein